jgi:hypothetical protein
LNTPAQAATSSRVDPGYLPELRSSRCTVFVRTAAHDYRNLLYLIS